MGNRIWELRALNGEVSIPIRFAVTPCVYLFAWYILFFGEIVLLFIFYYRRVDFSEFRRLLYYSRANFFQNLGDLSVLKRIVLLCNYYLGGRWVNRPRQLLPH